MTKVIFLKEQGSKVLYQAPTGSPTEADARLFCNACMNATFSFEGETFIWGSLLGRTVVIINQKTQKPLKVELSKLFGNALELNLSPAGAKELGLN